MTVNEWAQKAQQQYPSIHAVGVKDPEQTVVLYTESLRDGHDFLRMNPLREYKVVIVQTERPRPE